MPGAPEKPKEERLRETIVILKKLQEVGIGPTDPGYKDCQEKMTAWVRDGGVATHMIEFPRHGRRGELILPRRAGTPASFSLRVVA